MITRIMALYPQSILDEIRDRVSIVSYVGEHVPLKKSGRNHKGCCPFHSEKTPSFMVSDEKEIFHCFGCGEGGNIFSFVMKYEGLSFPEAVEHLASRAGVTLPQKGMTEGQKDKVEVAVRRKKLLYKINKFAAVYFRKQLTGGTSGDHARNYLKTRGILDEISTQHFLGYADDSWDALFKHLKENGVPLSEACELGLIKRRDTTGEYYDFFRGRLIFPIISPRKEVLGFGGRILDSEKEKEAAKYLNSPDSMIYHKSYTVYGLNVAQGSIREKDQVIIVEGYMDALALNQVGISNVIAPLGTALTTSHIRLIGRYTKNMVLIFDGDSAGIKATERSLPSFMEAEIMPNIVALADGRDPDDWVRENGGEALEQKINSAESLLAWFIKKRVPECGSDVTKKSHLISELQPYFNRLKSQVEFAHYRKLLSDELKVEEGDLTRQLNYSGQKAHPSLNAEGKHAAGRLRVERLLIALMLEHTNLIPRARDAVNPAYFSDESFKTLFTLVLAGAENGKFSVGRLLDQIADEELVSSIRSLTLGEDVDEENALEMLEDCIKYLAKYHLTERLKVITNEIKSAEIAKDDEKVLKLISEKNELLSQNL